MLTILISLYTALIYTSYIYANRFGPSPKKRQARFGSRQVSTESGGPAARSEAGSPLGTPLRWSLSQQYGEQEITIYPYAPCMVSLPTKLDDF